MSIEVWNVFCNAPDSKAVQILKNCNITLESGKITLLVGKTGSGKSTLLHVLAGLRPPAEGQVYFGSSPLWKNGCPDPHQLRNIAFVYQYPEHQFFLPTVREELKYSLKPLKLDPGRQELRIKEAALLWGLREELLEQSPFFLSGGEKRKAALASAMVTQPEWLLLDEPSSGLDSSAASRLAEQLEALRDERRGQGGILIATHDLDLFLPIADSVIVLKDGEIWGQWPTIELAAEPQVLEEAGIGIPACVMLASLTGDQQQLNPSSVGRPRGLKPADIAEGLAETLRTGNMLKKITVLHPAGMPLEEAAPAAEWPSNGRGESSRDSKPFDHLDPRSKWLVYLLFSVSIFIQPGWSISVAAMIIAIILAFYAQMPTRKWLKPLTPMVWFMLLSFGISGLRLNLSWKPFSWAGTAFDWEPAFNTLERLAPLLPVMAGGMLFAYCTSPMSMKKGLEAPLKAIPGFEKGAEAISLATSLLFRYVKWFPAEIERFALLASIRGKQGGKPGRVRIPQLPAFFTPLLLSIMQHAEELSVAMEARGYGKSGKTRTNVSPLQWKGMDSMACLMGIGIGVLLWVIGRVWG